MQDMLNRWDEFLEKLNEYEPNAGISDLLDVIHLCWDSEPVEVLTYGMPSLLFAAAPNVELKYIPYSSRIIIYKKHLYSDGIERIERDIYDIGLFDDMYVKKETVINVLAKVNDGYQMLYEDTISTERYTKSGFQKKSENKTSYSPAYIFISDEDYNKYRLFVTKDRQDNLNERVINVPNLISEEEAFCITKTHSESNISSEEINDFAVIYTKNDFKDTEGFPLFFKEDKTILYKQFIGNPLLQIPIFHSEGYDDYELTMHGQRISDARKFIDDRILLTQKIIKSEASTPSRRRSLASELNNIESTNL